MAKTITERFDKDGKLVERVTVEETKDESIAAPFSQSYPRWSPDWTRPIVTYWPHDTKTADNTNTGGSISCDLDGGITVHSGTDNICSTGYKVENITYTN